MNPSTAGLQPSPAASEHAAHQVPATPSLLSRKIDVIDLAEHGWERLQQSIAQRTPAVITGLAAQWPALERWSPENLSARYGHKTVRVYDASFGEPGANYMGSIDTMRFADFLRETLGEGRDLRMFLHNIGRAFPELLDDITFPSIGLRFSKHFVYSFFGCRGSTTPLHYDIDMGYVLHTAIYGRRRVRLFGPEQSSALHQHPFTVRSYVDLDDPDLSEHPALVNARGYEVLLKPGQTLFMPAGYWHEFHYLDAGLGMSMRAQSPRLSDRAQGLINLLTLSPIDRLGNKIAPSAWFDWKQRRAHARGLDSLGKTNTRRSQ